MEQLVINLLISLLLWWFLWVPLAQAIGGAIGAFLAQLLHVLGACFVGVVLLAWSICCIVVVAGRGVRRVR